MISTIIADAADTNSQKLLPGPPISCPHMRVKSQ